MTNSYQSRLPPVSAPGWRQGRQKRRRYRRRGTIVISTLWLFAAVPVWLYVQQTPSFTDVLLGAVWMIVSFFALTGWVIVSPRFEKPLIRYPIRAIGATEKADTYRHFGGTEIPEGRIVSSYHYHECAECGTEFVDGLKTETESHVVLLGVPVVRRGNNTLYFCSECLSEEWGDTEVSVETLDLHNPDRTTLDIPIPDIEQENLDSSLEKV